MRWKCTDELADALVHRPLGGLVVRAVARTPVTPDHLTFLSCGTGLCAAIYLALGHPAAAPLLLLSLVFDCSDGQLARLRGPSSWGRWLDGCSDTLVGIALHLALLARGIPVEVVAVAGASTFLQGMVFDGLKALYRGAQDIPVYSRVQRWMLGEGPVSGRLVRAVGAVGPTTHWVLLAVSALFDSYGTYLLYAVALSNLYLLILLARRHLAEPRLVPEER